MKKSSKAGSRILQGAKEALDFARGNADLKTAKALGLAVPPTLLARADEVIE